MQQVRPHAARPVDGFATANSSTNLLHCRFASHPKAHYFRSFPHDGKLMQLFVHLGCIISHFQTCIIIYAEYAVFVKYYANVAGLVRHDWVRTRVIAVTPRRGRSGADVFGLARWV